ncbi:MAG: hypothetical protein P9F75_05180 [Candidatus Contendobacter sp.]|nr:hypothetical protein [Candidatus Contendobacter sp.]
MLKKLGHWAFLASLGLTLLFGIGVGLSLLVGSNAHPVLDVVVFALTLGFVYLQPLLVALALVADHTRPSKVVVCGLLFGSWLLVIAAGWWITG